MEKKKISEKLNNELMQFNFMLDMLVGLCEEYQLKYNNNALEVNEDLNYVEGIFTYYNILLAKKNKLESNKKVPEISELIEKFKLKIEYIKSLKLVRDNKTSTINDILNIKNNEVKGELLGNNPNVKMVKLRLPILSFWSALKDVFLNFILMFVIFFAISGFINFASWTSIFDLVYFVLFFSLVEMISRFVLLTLFKKIIIKTIGAIMLLPFLISTVLVCVFPIFLEIDSYFSLIMILLLSTLIRKFIISYVQEKNMKSKLSKGGE